MCAGIISFKGRLGKYPGVCTQDVGNREENSAGRSQLIMLPMSCFNFPQDLRAEKSQRGDKDEVHMHPYGQPGERDERTRGS